MPTVSAARGCSPHARMRKPIGVLKSTNHATITSAKLSHTIRLSLPIAGPMYAQCCMNGSFTSGIVETPTGTSWPW